MKKKLKTNWILTLIGLALSGAANASDWYLGEPVYSGTGCKPNTVASALSPDGTQLSILYSDFVVETSRHKTVDRKNCNVAIPVHVPQGFSVAILGIDYRGFNSISSGVTNQFNVEYFFANRPGPRATQVFRGPLNDDFLIEHDLIASALVWSPCGMDTNLRTNVTMLMRGNRRDDAMSGLDSMDIDTSVLFHLQWRRC